MVADLEAGLGTTLRLAPGQVDVVLVVTEPTAKSIEVSRRATETAAARARVVVVANKTRDDDDVEAIRAVLGSHELAVIPEDAAIAAADREGAAPIDYAPDAPGVRALVELARTLAS